MGGGERICGATNAQLGMVNSVSAVKNDHFGAANRAFGAADDAVAIAVRKALTKGFRPAFNLVEKRFKDLDKLILQFGNTPEGRALIAAWKNARAIKDAGHGPGSAPTPTSVPVG